MGLFNDKLEDGDEILYKISGRFQENVKINWPSSQDTEMIILQQRLTNHLSL